MVGGAYGIPKVGVNFKWGEGGNPHFTPLLGRPCITNNVV